jgi:hypothetical protein
VAFEPESKLREIEEEAFAGCPFLKLVSLSASLELISGSAFLGSRLCNIVVNPTNPHLAVKDGFLVSLREPRLLRVCEILPEVGIPDSVEVIGESCISECEWLRRVTFGKCSKLRQIAVWAFLDCKSLKSFRLPASVTILERSCFNGCTSLSSISFPPSSQLCKIGPWAFEHCKALARIAIPSSVEEIGEGCFSDCRSLEEVKIREDSQLIRIQGSAFALCSSLRTLFIPSSVEFVGVECFRNCSSLSALGFSSAPKIRELLSLPPVRPDPIAIPDSVEILDFSPDMGRALSCTLQFGEGSKLTEFHRVVRRLTWSGFSPYRLFVRVSSRTLKRFRSNLEFA